MEQIENIVVDELKWAYEYALENFSEPLMIYGDISENTKLIDGFETVLAYFTSDKDYKDYIKSEKIKDLRNNYAKYITDRN
jgi:hypothetical protein